MLEEDYGQSSINWYAIRSFFNYHSFVNKPLCNRFCQRRFQVSTNNLNGTGAKATLAALETVSTIPNHERA